MKPYQVAILTIIIVIGISELSVPFYRWIMKDDRVQVGDVWQARMTVMNFRDNEETGTSWQMSYRKVVKVEDGMVTYVCQDDTTHYVEDIKTFTFNGAGYSSQRISRKHESQ